MNSERYKIGKNCQVRPEMNYITAPIYGLNVYVSLADMNSFIKDHLPIDQKDQFKDAVFYPVRSEICEDASIDVNFVVVNNNT